MIKITPIVKRKIVCVRADLCEYVMEGFTGTTLFFGVALSGKERVKQAISEIIPTEIA